MRRSRPVSSLLSVSLAFLLLPLSARAAITAIGDVDPADPSTWTSSTYGYVGKTTAGTVTVDGGSQFFSRNTSLGYSTSSFGTVMIDGTASTWHTSGTLSVGYDGNGSLSVTNGGCLAGYSVKIANSAHASGTVTVDGAGSTLIADYCLDVGTYGIGVLNITNGGRVSSNYSYIGYDSISVGAEGSKGTVTVDGTGSNWTTSDELVIGAYGSSGILNITYGGSVSTPSAHIGAYASGTATIDGAGSSWTTGGLTVGAGHEGVVFQNEGTVQVTGTLSFGNNSHYSKGTYNLNGGTLLVKALLRGDGAAVFKFGGGTLQATGALSSDLGMELTGNGGDAKVDTAGYPVVLSVLFGSSGLVKKGDGTLKIKVARYKGMTTVERGRLELAIAAQPPILAGAGVNIHNNLSQAVFAYSTPIAAADIVAKLIASYGPAEGPHWTTGQFRCGTADATHGLGWLDNAPALPRNVTVMCTYYGDADLDGTVDYDDLVNVLGNYGTSGKVWGKGDFTYDGMVGLDDLTQLLVNYGHWPTTIDTTAYALDMSAVQALVSAGITVVPEPSTVVLLLAAGVGLAVRGRRGTRKGGI
jgi:T5SS/PEP-CTERM-associated repeat protein